MNAKEAASILARFAAAWPAVDWSDDTVELWIRELEPVEYDHALVAADHAVRSLDWPPSLAWFRGTARAEAERHSPTFVALEAAEQDRPVEGDEALALLAAARAALRCEDTETVLTDERKQC